MLTTGKKARRAVSPCRSCPCIPRRRQYGDYSHALPPWSLGNKDRKAGELLQITFPAPPNLKTTKNHDKPAPQKLGCPSRGRPATLLVPLAHFLLVLWSLPTGFSYHSALLLLAQLRWVQLHSFLGLGWPPPPFHSPPAASPLALPVQHCGQFAFLPPSHSAPWPVATLWRKNGRGDRQAGKRIESSGVDVDTFPMGGKMAKYRWGHLGFHPETTCPFDHVSGVE